MFPRAPLLAAILGLAMPSLVSCKAENASGYQIEVDIMLSDTLGPTTTVSILEDGADLDSSIKDATVTLQLNGGTQTLVPYVDSFGYLLSGKISGSTPKAGDNVSASITIGAKQLGDTVPVPATPKVTAPATAQDASKAIVVAWDSSSAPPDEFQIAIADKNTAANNPMGYFENIAGDSTSYTIPAGTLSTGTRGVYVQVTAQNTHKLTGADYEPYSHFIISSAGGITFDTL